MNMLLSEWINDFILLSYIDFFNLFIYYSCNRNEMRTNKSFANECTSLTISDGITNKNISNNPSSGIGLNPNLNIED